MPMTDKKRFYKLDDIGIVGKQEKKSIASQKYHSKKTGEIFRRARQANKGSAKVKKVS
jgi:hypothetical protein